MQGTMKAARIYGFEKTSKSTDLLRVDEVPIPDIESGEVLIRVLGAGLNHGDLHMREDAVQYTSEVPTIPYLPMVIGHDGLGEVVEVGPDVSNVQVGDRVVVMCSITCGYCKFCRSDRQHLCLSHRVMGFIAKWGEAGSKRILRYKEGLWAEYCRVPANNVVRLRPDDDIDEMYKVSQMTVGYRALKRARLHSRETRHYIDFPELLELARRGVIDTRHVTTRFFPLESVNDAIDYIAKRGDDEPLWPMYAPDA